MLATSPQLLCTPIGFSHQEHSTLFFVSKVERREQNPTILWPLAFHSEHMLLKPMPATASQDAYQSCLLPPQQTLRHRQIGNTHRRSSSTTVAFATRPSVRLPDLYSRPSCEKKTVVVGAGTTKDREELPRGVERRYGITALEIFSPGRRCRRVMEARTSLGL